MANTTKTPSLANGPTRSQTVSGNSASSRTQGKPHYIHHHGTLLNPHCRPQIENWVKEAGFVNVHAKTLPFPVGTWPKDKKLKEVGAFNLISFLDNLEGMTLRLYTNAWGWQPEEIKVLCAQLRKEFKNPKMRFQHNFYVVYAQKPENAVD